MQSVAERHGADRREEPARSALPSGPGTGRGQTARYVFVRQRPGSAGAVAGVANAVVAVNASCSARHDCYSWRSSRNNQARCGLSGLNLDVAAIRANPGAAAGQELETGRYRRRGFPGRSETRLAVGFLGPECRLARAEVVRRSTVAPENCRLWRKRRRHPARELPADQVNRPNKDTTGAVDGVALASTSGPVAIVTDAVLEPPRGSAVTVSTSVMPTESVHSVLPCASVSWKLGSRPWRR